MPARLHLTSGQGPADCRMAVAHTLQHMGLDSALLLQGRYATSNT